MRGRDPHDTSNVKDSTTITVRGGLLPSKRHEFMIELDRRTKLFYLAHTITRCPP